MAQKTVYCCDLCGMETGRRNKHNIVIDISMSREGRWPDCKINFSINDMCPKCSAEMHAAIKPLAAFLKVDWKDLPKEVAE